MKVVVVESPAKARTIGRYLGDEYKVLASIGHVRDLPKRDGSVVPERDFEMHYEVKESSRKPLREISDAVRFADELILATDPDREGEAISWHVLACLQDRKLLKKCDVHRVVFHEVTRDAVLEAMANPREINMALVDAQQARMALDYLVGFNLSPVLWRKLPGSRSAGRVQSVALRMICERESEIEAFTAREYWSVNATLSPENDKPFTARLHEVGGQRVNRFDLSNEHLAALAAHCVRTGTDSDGALVSLISGNDAATVPNLDASLDKYSQYKVASVERREVKQKPRPPFTTSTLQQEASHKIGMGVQRTMRTAQKLYEGVAIAGETVGLITYMRTDSIAISQQSIQAAREVIRKRYGDSYLPSRPHVFKSSARNAQEAHEAIRPTDLHRTPQEVDRFLDKDQSRLYALIWNRTIASQMALCVTNQVTINIGSLSGDVVLRTSGSIILFDGFRRLYREGRDEPDPSEEANTGDLPNVNVGDLLTCNDVTTAQHFEKPPARFSEASLVKNLEERGIGRPSTYAAIIRVLQDREYVRLDSRRFVPEVRGRVVTAFLESFFERYVAYGFTAKMEEELDRISNSTVGWKEVLREFWGPFRSQTEDARLMSPFAVSDAIEKRLERFIFPANDNADARTCPRCGDGRIGIRMSKGNIFLGCSKYPECRFASNLGADQDLLDNEPRNLGRDPKSGEDVTLRKGPYGIYVQLGDGSKNKKPPRSSIPPEIAVESLTLETALQLLSLPREVGLHPDSNEPILAAIGRFGPYLKCKGQYTKLPSIDDVLTIGLNRAVAIVNEDKGSRTSTVLREIGNHPHDGAPIEIKGGRYGPYVAHGRTNASLRKDQTPDSITLESALDLLEAKKSRPKKSRTTKSSSPRRRGRKSTPRT